MSEDILISVIVPAYNIEKYIGDCLDSILCQTYTNLEIIVVDDGSTDSTGAIIDSYATKDNRIIAIHQSNTGQDTIRKKTVFLAKGVYTGFVDGDDCLMPDMYERLLKNAVQYHADISHCGVVFCYENGRKDNHYNTGILKVQDSITAQNDLFDGQLIEPGLCNKLYRTELLRLPSPQLRVVNNEDLLWNAFLFRNSSCSVFEDRCGYCYLQRSGSTSKNPAGEVQRATDVLRVRTFIADNCLSETTESAYRLLLNTCVNISHDLMKNHSAESELLKKECKEKLQKYRAAWKYIGYNQKIAAFLIVYFPWLLPVAYKIYTIFKKR